MDYIIEHQNLIKSNILNSFSNQTAVGINPTDESVEEIIKSNEDELQLNELTGEVISKAGGEGSKGGKIIGHTKSGKPIYDSANHAEHKDFTSDDHKDAVKTHEDLGNKRIYGEKGFDESKMKHQNLLDKHLNEAAGHGEKAKEKEDKEEKIAEHEFPDEKEYSSKDHREAADFYKKQLDGLKKVDTTDRSLTKHDLKEHKRLLHYNITEHSRNSKLADLKANDSIEKGEIADALGYSANKFTKTGKELKGKLIELSEGIDKKKDKLVADLSDALEGSTLVPTRAVDSWNLRGLTLACPYKMFDWEQCYFQPAENNNGMALAVDTKTTEGKTTLASSKEEADKCQKYNDMVRNYIDCLVDCKTIDTFLKNVKDTENYQLSLRELTTLGFD